MHRKKLFDKTSIDPKARLNEGQLIDTSRLRGRTNLGEFRAKHPMTGRQVESYKLMLKLMQASVKIVNVYEMSGIGKTCFVVETAYYMHSRLHFQDGVFLLKLNNVKTVEQLKAKLRDLSIIKEDLISEY